ncbi:MAG: flagellar hook-length control protein FliK [Pseudomonadota bacterium]
MEIKALIDVSGSQQRLPVNSDWLNLLRQLESLEASVARQRSGELVLRTLLGDLLLKNSLGFKQGDRLAIRLDESRATPILKVAPAIPKVHKINSDQLPLLSHLIGPDRAALVSVRQVSGDEALIELANRTFKLPVVKNAKSGELLSIYHAPRQRKLEISQFNPLPVYKGLLRQLVPRQSVSAVGDFMQLLKVFKPVESEALPPQRLPITEKIMAQASKPPATKLAASSAAISQTFTDTVKPVPDPGQSRTITAKTEIDSTNQQKNTRVDEAPVKTVPPSYKTVLTHPDAVSKAGSNTVPPASFDRPEREAPTPKQPQTKPYRINQAVADAKVTIDQLPQEQALASTKTLARSEKKTVMLQPESGLRNQTDPVVRVKGNPERIPQMSANLPASHIRPEFQITQAPEMNRAIEYRRLVKVQNNTATSPPEPTSTGLKAESLSQPVSNSKTGNHILSPPDIALSSTSAANQVSALLETAIPARDIQAEQIKQWFSFWGLIRPGDKERFIEESTNPFKALSRIADQEKFLREISQPRAITGNATEAKENPEQTRPVYHELSASQIREGVRLIESSLTQFLLQRASLGMQQESELPLNINLALPLLDDNELIPVTLTLNQRDADSPEARKSWDIRINFEFAELGPICCHLFLQDENLAVSFYSENPRTRDRFDAALPMLRTQLLEAGFIPGELHSFQGIPTAQQSMPSLRGIESLLDIRV